MESKPLALKILDVTSIIVLIISTYLALIFAPTELVMGDVQRVFYFHIGTAWTALIGFLLGAVFSVSYLITKDLKWDRLQVAAIEVSMVFFFITIVLGSIWARPAWNTWWTWDPRLTTAAVTELIYAADSCGKSLNRPEDARFAILTRPSKTLIFNSPPSFKMRS